MILFGDASSNKFLQQISGKLPITFPKDQVLLMIYPNPTNPSKYVVLNSGFTFREESNITNSRQIPMLPDWAVIDISTPPDARYPGKIVRGGFFDENWATK